MIYTIGHSNYKVEAFIEMLKNYKINCLCDVRSTPYSKYVEQFNRENFKKELEKKGILYLFFGDEFGARRDEKDVITDGIVDFNKVAKSDKFLMGISRISNGIKKGFNIALMCTEKEPIECHRTILVSKNLNDKGMEIRHILSSGLLKSQKQIESDLIDKYFSDVKQLSFFEGNVDYLTEAYKKANLEIGYKRG